MIVAKMFAEGLLIRHREGRQELVGVFISGGPLLGFIATAKLHEYVKRFPHSIWVNVPPYPALIPITKAGPVMQKTVCAPLAENGEDYLYRLKEM